ncbi:hypothetical protein ACFX1R_006638 [Malus domestica]
MNKAYDKVEWDFLEEVMIRMGFHSRLIFLIMSCVRSVSFSISLNGRVGDSFKPSRGIRQGDPLSPYLFLFVTEALSTRISAVCSENVIQSVSLSSGGPIISHLLFADDSLFFLKATPQTCSAFIHILHSYCEASGQQINYDKSTMFFSANTPHPIREEIGTILNMSESSDPGKYLGLPTVWGRSKTEALAYVKSRIQQKIQSWKINSLSQVGREVLIKVVAYAVPTYPMNCFLFPLTLCRELDALFANFWWGQKEDESRIHWRSWETICLPKAVGGLGFRSFSDFNKALLAKQFWCLTQEPESFWAKVLKGRYFPNVDALSATKGSRASWAWSSLLEGQAIIIQGARWQIGNGAAVSI